MNRNSLQLVGEVEQNIKKKINACANYINKRKKRMRIQLLEWKN